MTRQLASIQKILNIEAIPDADNILKCTILGWSCVIAKKDNFKVGDLVVYIEIDSVVSERPEFEFLRERKFRIRTIKLRKQVSQGLVLPLSILPSNKKYKENDDVTEILGVKKYDPEGDLERKLAEEKANRTNNKIQKFLLKYPWYRRLIFKPKQGGFPKFIKKTDESRIQLFPDICEREKNTIFQITEKLDGQSVTLFLLKKSKHKFLFWSFGSDYQFGVCSRNLYLPKENDSSYWTIAKQYNIKKVLENLMFTSPNNNLVVLQGEIIGNNIQGNKYKINGYKFYAFNLLINGKPTDTKTMLFVLNDKGIETVPLLSINFELKSTIPEMVEYSKGKSLLADIPREGVVIRNYDKFISFKVVNPDFLLKYEE